ncbi:hypothetical protein TNCV_5082481 [Trichonephila clavipes]|nr:hypothetical protein TNCV_5082481 [Trichonephila clavipes]
MGKLHDLDAFDHGQIIDAQRMGHLISEIVTQLGFSRSKVSRVYQEYMDGGQKTSYRARQLALTVVRDGSSVLYVASVAKHWHNLPPS